MVSIAYVKMHGCHNDYIFIDHFENQIPGFEKFNWKKIIQTLSDRSKGIGADGVIFLEAPSGTLKRASARMRMFNADGTEGKMGGNGIRCLTKLLYEKWGPQDVFCIETEGGIRDCYVIDAKDPQCFLVKVNMGRPHFLPSEIPVLSDDLLVLNEEIEAIDQKFHIHCVSLGNPHCVIEVDDLDAFDVKKYGSFLEKHAMFPEGINIEFIERRAGRIRQRTWERGSGETLACGTGACATAVILILRHLEERLVKIELRGGEVQVEWDGLREVWMTGEAVTELSGIFNLPL